MKIIKSLILSSAAGLVALSGAQAADLPVKAKAVEYVKVCSLYGAGFWYIPGTDTCIKLGGQLEVQTTINGGIGGSPNWSGNNGASDRFRDMTSSRERMTFQVDTRTATEYGVVRTFGDLKATFDTQNAANGTNAVVDTAVLGSNSNTAANAQSQGYTAVGNLFIQFAGFTFGKSASAYAAPWHSFPGNQSAWLLGGEDSVTGVPNIQYSADLGGGMTIAVGADEQRVYGRTNNFNVTTGSLAANAVFGGSIGTNSYTGNRAPDLVGSFKVDQAWGLMQLSAAAHDVTATYYTPALETLGHPNDVWGFAVQGALQIKNIPTGAGDDIKISAAYADGAAKYIFTGGAGTPPGNFNMFGGTGNPAAYQSLGFGAIADGVFAGTSNANGTGIQKTQAYGFRGAYNHNWDPYWSTALYGAASWMRYSGSATDAATGVVSAAGLVCAKMAGANGYAAGSIGTTYLTAGAGYSCNPNFAVYQLGIVTRWTPVKNLTFSAEVMWMALDQNNTGLFSNNPAAGPMPGGLAKPAATYEFKDQNTVMLNVRAQRNF